MSSLHLNSAVWEIPHLGKNCYSNNKQNIFEIAHCMLFGNLCVPGFANCWFDGGPIWWVEYDCLWHTGEILPFIQRIHYKNKLMDELHEFVGFLVIIDANG